MTKEWEKYRNDICSLYSQHSLATVRQMMIDQHNFHASIRAYRGRLDRWGLRKYNRRKRHGSVNSGGSDSGEYSDHTGAGPATVGLDPPSTDAVSQYRNETETNLFPESHDVGAGLAQHNAATGPNNPYDSSINQYTQTHRQSSSSQGYDEQGRVVLSSPSSTSASLQPPGYQPQPPWDWSVSRTDATTTDATTTAAATYPPYLGYHPQQSHDWSQPSSGDYGNTGESGGYGYHHHDQLINNPAQIPYSTNTQAAMPPSPSSGPHARSGRHHYHNYGAPTDNVQGYGMPSQSHSERSRRR